MKVLKITKFILKKLFLLGIGILLIVPLFLTILTEGTLPMKGHDDY